MTCLSATSVISGLKMGGLGLHTRDGCMDCIAVRFAGLSLQRPGKTARSVIGQMIVLLPDLPHL
jgi:hypothetical protein